jgi:hypothetical protein
MSKHLLVIAPFIFSFEVVRRGDEIVSQAECILRGRNARALPVSLLVIASVFAVAFMMASTALGEPVPRATGNASFQGGTGLVSISLSVCDSSDELGEDRGKYTYSDTQGYFVMDVREVRVFDGNLAIFTGQATESTHPSIDLNEWIVQWVLDVGRPCEGMDCYQGTGNLCMEDAYSLVSSGEPPPWPWMIAIGGNINVQEPS